MGFIKGYKTKILATLAAVGQVAELLKDGFQQADIGLAWPIIATAAALWLARDAASEAAAKK